MEFNPCCCTSVHNHCENVVRIEEIQKTYRANANQNDARYIQEMADISEYAEEAPGALPPIICNRYDGGLYVWPEFLEYLKNLLKEKCPSCNKVYKEAEILCKSFGPGAITEICCEHCKNIKKIEKYSDL